MKIKMKINRQTGYTSAMIGLMHQNRDTILVCGSQVHASHLSKKYPQIEPDRFMSIGDLDSFNTEGALILYDNFALMKISDCMEEFMDRLEKREVESELYLDLLKDHECLKLKLRRLSFGEPEMGTGHGGVDWF